MTTKLLILAGILSFGASLQADTSYILNFNTQSNSPGLQYDGSYAISPYTGTVNGTTLSLYCDDFNDNIYFGQQNVSVYSTALTATGATLQNDTRYGVHNASTTYAGTAGTTLYDEMAWLATQMRNTSGASAASNDVAIQEAIWTLTGAPSENPPHNSSGFTGDATSGLAGAAQSYLTWIADAQSYVAAFNGTTSGWGNAGNYAALVTGNWYIVTAVTSAGCTTGMETNGCSGAGGTGAGTAGSGGVTQEFLAYHQGSGNSPVPEPASFALIGSGLLFGALLRRRLRA